VLATALVLGAFTFAATWPGFEPKQIAVTGNHRVTREEILAHAAVARRLSMWLQNTSAMAARVASIPYVATVRVRRIPPATIRIAVTERVPFAVIESGEDAVLVDRTLRVLESASGTEALPVFSLQLESALAPGVFVKSRGAVELRTSYDAMAARQLSPVELAYDRYGGLVATLHGGLRLLLGSPADLDQKITLANAIIAQVVGRRRVAAIDLRAPAAPVLIYR
jgi:cell division protein FtsQ